MHEKVNQFKQNRAAKVIQKNWTQHKVKENVKDEVMNAGCTLLFFKSNQARLFSIARLFSKARVFSNAYLLDPFS